MFRFANVADLVYLQAYSTRGRCGSLLIMAVKFRKTALLFSNFFIFLWRAYVDGLTFFRRERLVKRDCHTNDTTHDSHNSPTVSSWAPRSIRPLYRRGVLVAAHACPRIAAVCAANDGGHDSDHPSPIYYFALKLSHAVECAAIHKKRNDNQRLSTE